MALRLYLVRGNDADGENQDWFVVAPHVERAIDIWNDTVVSEPGLGRVDGDAEEALPRRETHPPFNIREVLPDVAGTRFEGAEGPVGWPSLRVVFAGSHRGPQPEGDNEEA